MLETRCTFRVGWGDCDPAQIVYNPNYNRWMEHGIESLISAIGYSRERLMHEEPEFRGVPLVASNATYHAPAPFGADLTRITTVDKIGRSSFGVTHRFRVGDELVAEASQTRVWSGVNAGVPTRLRSRPIPEPIRAALEADRMVVIRTD